MSFTLLYDPGIPESVAQRKDFEEVLKNANVEYELQFGNFSEPFLDTKACAAVYPPDTLPMHGGYRGAAGLYHLKQRLAA